MYEAGLYLLICLVSDNVPQLFFAGVPLLRHLFTASSGIGTSLAEVELPAAEPWTLDSLLQQVSGGGHVHPRTVEVEECLLPPP